MKTATINISFDEEKLTALRIFITQKNLDLDNELESFMEQLFKRYVPKNVQEYLELKDSITPLVPLKKPESTKPQGYMQQP